ncbi:MAG: hypothetical protein QXT39_05035 [Conexivisphaerales archaeon]
MTQIEKNRRILKKDKVTREKRKGKTARDRGEVVALDIVKRGLRFSHAALQLK